MKGLRADYLVFLIVHLITSVLLGLMIAINGGGYLCAFGSMAGCGPSFPVELLLSIGGAGIFSGVFIGVIFLTYGLYQRLSDRRSFESRQFLTIFLISAMIAGGSAGLGLFLEERDKRQAKIEECVNIVQAKYQVKESPVRVSDRCIEPLRQVTGNQDLASEDRLRYTKDGIEVVNPGG